MNLMHFAEPLILAVQIEHFSNLETQKKNSIELIMFEPRVEILYNQPLYMHVNRIL